MSDYDDAFDVRKWLISNYDDLHGAGNEELIKNEPLILESSPRPPQISDNPGV